MPRIRSRRPPPLPPPAAAAKREVEGDSTSRYGDPEDSPGGEAFPRIMSMSSMESIPSSAAAKAGAEEEGTAAAAAAAAPTSLSRQTSRGAVSTLQSGSGGARAKDREGGRRPPRAGASSSTNSIVPARRSSQSPFAQKKQPQEKQQRHFRRPPPRPQQHTPPTTTRHISRSNGSGTKNSGGGHSRSSSSDVLQRRLTLAGRRSQAKIRSSSLASMYNVFQRLDDLSADRFGPPSPAAAEGASGSSATLLKNRQPLPPAYAATRYNIEKFRSQEQLRREQIWAPSFATLDDGGKKLVLALWLQAKWRLIRSLQVRKKRRKKRFQLAKWWEERNNNAASPVHRKKDTHKLVSRQFKPWSARIHDGGNGDAAHGIMPGAVSGIWPPPSSEADPTGAPRVRRASKVMRQIAKSASFQNAVDMTNSDRLSVGYQCHFL